MHVINMKRTSHSLWQLILRCELVLAGLFGERGVRRSPPFGL